MKNRWWKEAIVYQIYPRSFKDSNGDGIGDLQGIIEKLPYLSDLGINTIWICPFYKSPMVDNGYDISDYYGIDETFGTMDDFDQLIQRSKQHKIKILIDLVLNHTSNEHEWFQSALNDPNSPYRDYYIFKPGKENEQPTNWRSVFGGSVWEKIEDDMYYMHTFDKLQPDLNWENANMREELYDMINFWLDKGVAGFRIDAITFIKKNQEFPILPVDNIDQLASAAPVSQNVDGIAVFLQEMKERTYGRVDGMTVAEAPGVPYNELDAYIGDEGHFSMIFDFSYNDIDVHESGNWYDEKQWGIKELRDAIFNSQLNIQKIGWGALYLENHDQPRSSNKYIPSNEINFYSKSALAMMYFCLRGTPFIYQGQEIGMTNVKFNSITEIDDLAAIDQYHRALAAGINEQTALKIANDRSRDNSRTPMHWDDSKFAGFSTVQPWIKVNENYPQINVKAQEHNETSLLAFYKQLIQLRKESNYKEVLTYGTIAPTLLEHESMIAYERILENKKVLVMTNLSQEIIILPNVTFETVILNNYEAIDIVSEGIVLKPYQSLLLEV